MGRPTHGANGTPLYKAWCGMRVRCRESFWRTNPTYRGVQHDSRWATFEGFVANPPSGEYRPGLHLSRIGDQGDYTPENTRWITLEENTREMWDRLMVRLPDGRIATHVAEANGLSSGVWQRRVARGWPIEDAVSVPASEQHVRAARTERTVRMKDGRDADDVARQNGVGRAWRQRWRKGWPLEDAVSTPLRSYQKTGARSRVRRAG